MSVKAKIEAVLFLTDKPIHAAAIARIVNEDVQVVRQTLLELIHDYEGRGSGLEIAQDNGYMIQVKDEYSSIIEEFLPMEMSAALLRTLSAIAIKQPVLQSDIVRIRGAGAYDHIKELLNRELISKKEEGRSPVLATTKKFQDYFRLTRDAKSLRQQIRKQEAPKPESGGVTAGAEQLGLPLTTGSDSPVSEVEAGTSTAYDAAIENLLDTAIDSVSEDESATDDSATRNSESSRTAGTLDPDAMDMESSEADDRQTGTSSKLNSAPGNLSIEMTTTTMPPGSATEATP